MKVRKVNFDFQGKKIGGFLYLPEGQGPFPAVVFVHGFGGGTHEAKNKFMCEKLAQEGIIAFQFDFYDHPNHLSEIPIESMTVSLQLRILRKGIDFVSGLKSIDPERIGLTGHSLGGMTVLLYTPTDNRIKALVVQSAVSDFGQTKATAFEYHPQWKREGYKLFDESWGKMKVSYDFIKDGLRHKVYGAMGKIKCPVLVFHGDEDEFVDVRQAKKQIKHLKSTGKLVIIPGADHGYRSNNSLVPATKLLVNFMTKNLKLGN